MSKNTKKIHPEKIHPEIIHSEIIYTKSKPNPSNNTKKLFQKPNIRTKTISNIIEQLFSLKKIKVAIESNNKTRSKKLSPKTTTPKKDSPKTKTAKKDSPKTQSPQSSKNESSKNESSKKRYSPSSSPPEPPIALSEVEPLVGKPLLSLPPPPPNSYVRTKKHNDNGRKKHNDNGTKKHNDNGTKKRSRDF